MRHTVLLILLLLVSGLVFQACSRKAQPSSTSTTMEKSSGLTSALPPCIIYQTKGDYSHLVPVLLSDDKSRIVMYPDVRDIQKQGEEVYPAVLKNGFYLDNRGIGPTVAFLDMTYEEYGALPATPTADELFQRIRFTDPLIVMYQCGTRGEQEQMIEKLNGLIEEGAFQSCKKLK